MSSLSFREIFDSHKWEATPLGSRASWPPILSSSVQFMLDTPQPMFLMYGPERILIFNEAYVSILGPRWQEALGASLPVLWAEIWPEMQRFVEESSAGKAGLAENVPLRTWASGFQETRYYTFSYTPIRDPGGRIVGGACINMDTTEKVEAAARVAQERNQLFRLFENTPGFIAMTEGPEHLFTFANEAYLRFIGLDSVVGRTVAEAMPDIAAQGFVDLLDRVYATGEPYEASGVPIRIAAKDGGEASTRYASFIYEAVRDDDGRVTGLFCEGIDITAERRAQEKLGYLEAQLIHLSRASAMGTMASTLGHELKQPLTAIRSYSTTALRLLGRVKEPPADLIQCLNGIEHAAVRAGKTINSVRSMTQQNMKASIERASLTELVHQAVELAIAGSKAYRPHLDYHLEDIEVLVDPIQIQQVVINIVNNALDAMHGSERPELRITSSVTPKGALLCIDDTGGGIDPEFAPILFDAFATTKEEGTGIGLSISRTIIEAHGGTIWAEASASGGASFRFTLPLADEAQPS